MAFCWFDNTLPNIKKILEYGKTVENFETLSAQEQVAIRALIKEEEEFIESKYSEKKYYTKDAECKSLHGLPSGIDQQPYSRKAFSPEFQSHSFHFPSLIDDGLPLGRLQIASNFYTDTKIHDVYSNWGTLGKTQMDHWLEYYPRTKLFYDNSDSNTHVLGVKRAQLYAHLTHYYKEAIGGIAKMLENTKIDGLNVKLE